jgi:hypothetical protein
MDVDFALFGVIIAGFCLCGLSFSAQYSQWCDLAQADRRRQSSLRELYPRQMLVRSRTMCSRTCSIVSQRIWTKRRPSVTPRQFGRNESRGNDA